MICLLDDASPENTRGLSSHLGQWLRTISGIRQILEVETGQEWLPDNYQQFVDDFDRLMDYLLKFKFTKPKPEQAPELANLWMEVKESLSALLERLSSWA